MTQINHISQLKFDPQNTRKRTIKSSGMIERSLQKVGAARSIVIDENGTILAGNGTVEAAGQVGIEKVKVIEADGETIVAVKRSGLTEEQKIELSLYDNRTAELSEWDAENLLEIAEDIDLSEFFNEDELTELMQKAVADNEGGEERSSGGSGDRCDVIVNCGSLSEQEQVLEFLQGYGYKCKAL